MQSRLLPADGCYAFDADCNGLFVQYQPSINRRMTTLDKNNRNPVEVETTRWKDVLYASPCKTVYEDLHQPTRRAPAPSWLSR